MEVCAAVLLGFPPDEESLVDDVAYDKAVRSHINKLNTLGKEQAEVLQQNAAQLLQLLNPRVNSISYLVVLERLLHLAETDKPVVPQADLLDYALEFLLHFDPRQMRYAGSLLAVTLLEKAARGTLFPPLIAVEATVTALLRIDPTGSMLTTIHYLVAKYAYSVNCTGPLIRLIEKPIVYYSGMANGASTSRIYCDMTLPPPSFITAMFPAELKAHHVLEYDLICGLVWCAEKNWQLAFDAFERVITYPTKDNGTSKVMVEAYKRWVLVGLLLHGQMPVEPPYTSSAARKAYGTLGRPYVALATAFATTNATQLKTEAATSTELWTADNTLGLVGEVLQAYQKWQIINLQDVYTKISIPELRQATQSAESGAALEHDQEVEALLADMIETGMLRGEITRPANGSPAYVTFTPVEDDLPEEEFAEKLAETAQRVKALGAVFKVTKERLGTNREFVRHLIREQRRLEKEGDKAQPATFDSQIEDEDLMTGLVANS